MLLYVSLLDSGSSASTNAVETNKQTTPIRFFIIIPLDFRKYGLLLVYEEQHTSVIYIYIYTEAVISFNNDIIFLWEWFLPNKCVTLYDILRIHVTVSFCWNYNGYKTSLEVITCYW